jgi:hypothetical protein
MKTCFPFVAALVVGLAPFTLLAADPASFAGEYADKNYLKGKAFFQMSLEQTGTDVSVFFSAAHNDGSGAAPEADGKGEVTGQGTVAFTWKDNFNNSGTGTIKKAGKDVIVSIEATSVVDSRCLMFYGHNIRLETGRQKIDRETDISHRLTRMRHRFQKSYLSV